MKYPRLAIWTVAAVHLLLFFVLLLWWKPHEGSLWIDFSCFSLLLSQGFLLGLWAALGGKPTPWRATSLVIVAASWGWFTHYQKHDYTLAIAIATIFLTGQTIQVMGILLLARFMGLGLNRATDDYLGHLQFSIGQALSWMTALAVFLGATHYLYFLDDYFDKRVLWLPALGLAMCLAAMWLILGSRWITLRCFTLILIIGLGTVWIGRVEPMPWWQAAALLGGEAVVTAASLVWWQAAHLLVCEAVLTAVSLAVARLAGYRLVWHWPFRRLKPDQT